MEGKFNFKPWEEMMTPEERRTRDLQKNDQRTPNQRVQDAERLRDLRESKFFDQFGIDEDVLCRKIAEYHMTGNYDELENFFYENYNRTSPEEGNDSLSMFLRLKYAIRPV